MERTRNNNTELDVIDAQIQQLDILRENARKLKYQIWRAQRGDKVGMVFNSTITDMWAIYHSDCIAGIAGIPDNSIHYSIFSPPFLSLYVYSDDFRDMGNSKTDDEFYKHFEFLIPELFRVLKDGRLVTVHCSVVNKSITHDGVMGLKDLPGEIVRLFEKHGFIYHSKVNVWKDPLIQATRTKSLMLAHKQISKDSSRCGIGFADELLTFRKPGINEEPIAHGRGFERYIGELPEPDFEKNNNPKINKYSHHVWQRYASPVWFDINQSHTLNAVAGKDVNDERHICPLQLDVIERCMELWTNPGDIVLSPFAGIGSEGYVAIKNNRKFVGFELKESYYRQAIKNMKSADNIQNTIF